MMLRTWLTGLNGLSRIRAVAELSKCCGSRAWAERMAERRPFEDFERLATASDEVWWALGRADWLEAFSHHPRIGEREVSDPACGGRTGGTPVPTGASAWTTIEQSGMAGASDEVRLAFARGNEEYERKFGHVFLICATGRSGEEMLGQLQERLGNGPEAELRNAASEQAKITRLRLEKLLA
jgi:2-oxo-4-hydroxy-4-carboxy-5-ureidoimidazoline decarboxylase